MPTIANLLSRALRKISSDSPGDTANGADVVVALDELNAMLDEWSDDNLIIPSRTIESFPLVAGTSSYSIGTGATFNTSRPDVIQGIFTRDSNNNDMSVDTLTRDQYNDIPVKSSQGRPYKYFYDTQYPNGIIYLYSTPDSAYTLYIDSLKPLSRITNTSADLSMPGGYENLIVLNLAVRLAPDFGFPLQEENQLVIEAKRLKKKVKRRNVKSSVASFDPFLLPRNGRLNGWNIYNV